MNRKDNKKHRPSRLFVLPMTFALACGLCATGSASEDNSDAASLIADIPTTQAFTDDPVAEEDIETILQAGMNAPSSMNGQPWHFTAITDADVLQQIADGMGDFGGTPPAGVTSDDAPDVDASISVEDDSEDSETAEESNAEASAEEGSDTEDASAEESSDTEDASAEENSDTANVSAEESSEADADAEPDTAAGAMTSKAGLTDAPLAIVISCEEGSEFDAGLACQTMSAEAQLLGYGTKIISSPTIALNGDDQEEYKELLGIPEDQTATAILLIGTADTSADTTSSATERNSAEDTITYVTAE